MRCAGHAAGDNPRAVFRGKRPRPALASVMGGDHQQIRGSADRDEGQRVTTRPVRKAGPGARAPRLTISMAIGIDATSRTTMKPSASRKRSPRASRNTSTIPHSRKDRTCRRSAELLRRTFPWLSQRLTDAWACTVSAPGFGDVLAAAARGPRHPAGTAAASPRAPTDGQALTQTPRCNDAVPVTRCQSRKGGSGARAGWRHHA